MQVARYLSKGLRSITEVVDAVMNIVYARLTSEQVLQKVSLSEGWARQLLLLCSPLRSLACLQSIT